MNEAKRIGIECQPEFLAYHVTIHKIQTDHNSYCELLWQGRRWWYSRAQFMGFDGARETFLIEKQDGRIQVNFYFFRSTSAFSLGTLFPLLAMARQRSDDADGAAACGCLGAAGIFMIIFAVVWIGLVIALLVWVAKDAKARGLDNSILWMVLVMFTSLLGLVIYLLSRPKGNLIACPRCGNKRLEASAKCPHCGNA